jgi:6-phosphogluconolactonase
LSLAAIVSARALMIAITGQEKKDVLERAISEGAGSTLPIGRVLAETELPVDIHWSL